MSAIAPTATTTCPSNHQTELWTTYQEHKSNSRMLFPLEGAKQLNVSELELMLASPHSQYLGTQCRSILEALAQFERIESIVRNEFAVHEKIGRLDNLNLGQHMGIALNVGGLDMRFFIKHWHHALALTDTSKADKQGFGSYSVQFYDGAGRAICKIFLRDNSDKALQQWQDLVSEYANNIQDADINNIISTLDTPLAMTPWQPKILAAEKQKKLQQKWLALTDIHQFHMLLKSLGVDRASSYLQAPPDMAIQLQPEAIEDVLTLIKAKGEPLMVFVGNSGMVQIQTGVVHNVKRMGDWINILDKQQTDFTLHLKDKALAQVWCVKRPTKDGVVTCVEGFDSEGNSMVTFFGQRQEGEPEHAYWQEITATLIDKYSIQL